MNMDLPLANAAVASGFLSPESIRETLSKALEGKFTGQKLLVLVPDHTRSLPLPFLFRALLACMQDARQIDVLVALGTHPGLSEESLNELVGVTPAERGFLLAGRWQDMAAVVPSSGVKIGRSRPPVSLSNHSWDDPASLVTLGTMEQDEIRQIAGDSWHPSLPDHVAIRLNKAAFEHDHILILGPVFPHEVIGFSGGAKYLFPGISGPEMINATHWLGALAGVVKTIGFKQTPARAMIHAAAARLSTPVTLIAPVVQDHDLRGIFIGGLVTTWNAAADLSASCHIRWVEKPFNRVLSCAPPMYDELWTAAKAMYKLEPAVIPGGEVIIYAPHLNTVSLVHGKYIAEIGYHILPYFLQDWERYKHIPLGVLAHSTHLRGSGHMENGLEKPNVQVTLSSRIPPEVCSQLNLGYLDPAQIDPTAWQDREDEGILYVPKAGEILYRCKP